MKQEWTDDQKRLLACAFDGASQATLDIMFVKHTLLAVHKVHDEAATDGVLSQLAQIELVSTTATAAMALEQIGGQLGYAVAGALQSTLNALNKKEPN